MQKRDEIKNPTSCLNKAADDEPLFVLRAKDPAAAQTVRFWVAMASQEHLHEDAKCREARRLAEEMEEWRRTHVAAELKAGTA